MSAAAEALLRSLVTGAPPALPAPQEWQEVEEILAAHRLSGWAWAGIARADAGEALPLEPRARLHAAHWEAEQANRAAAREASLAIDALRDEGIDPVALKGFALLSAIYADPGARPMGDVDWLIDAAERDRAGSVLRELGFESEPGGSPDADVYCAPEGTTLDLHHRFRLFEGCDLEPLTTLARAPLLDSGSLRVLAPEAMLAHLVFHLVGHRPREGVLLGWIVDIALALRAWEARLDPDAVRALLPSGPARRALDPVLGFCVHRLGAPWAHGSLPDAWRLDRIVRARRRAAWNLSSPRGWLALAASTLGVELEHERPPLRPGDLRRAPLDWLEEQRTR